MRIGRLTAMALSLAACLAPAPLVAAGIPVATQDPGEVAAALASALLSDERALAETENIVAESLRQLLAKNADVAALVNKYPGLDTAVTTAWRPKLVDVVKTTMPLHRAEVAALYRGRMTLPNCVWRSRSWSSPSGQRFIETFTRKSASTAIVGQVLNEQPITQSALRADTQQTAKAMVSELSPADVAALGRFVMSPAGQKMKALTPERQQIDLKWANYSTPEDDKAMTDLTRTAMIAHIRKTDPKFADALAEAMARADAANK